MTTKTTTKKTLKTAVFTLLAAVMLFSSAPLKMAHAATTFSDVPERHWAYPYIEEAVSEGFINGIGDGLFAPDENISYGQFASMMTKAFYMDEFKKYTGPLSPWYVPYCEVCNQVGIFENTFLLPYGNWANADKEVTRYDMAMMMYNAMVDQGYTVSSSDINAQRSKIADLRTFPSSFITPVAALMSLGCINGIDSQGTFSGLSNMNRAQAATAMVRMYNLVTGQELPSGSSTPSKPATDPEPAPVPDDTDSTFHIGDYFYLGQNETVQSMMNRVNAATPAYREGYLTNGKPITDANIQEMLDEIKKNFPDGMEWNSGSRYYYITGMYGHGRCGGCNSWAAAVSDALFGEDAPVITHHDFYKIKPGDVYWRTSNYNNGHVVFAIGYPDEYGYFKDCEGNVSGKIHWIFDEGIELLKEWGPEWVANSTVYSRY